MPTYDYRCNGCGHTFELFQSMSAQVKRRCPECGKNTLERLIGTGAAVLFKGSGFYETDYRSKSYKDAAKSDKDAASPKAAKTDKAASATPAKPDTSAKGGKTDSAKKPLGSAPATGGGATSSG